MKPTSPSPTIYRIPAILAFITIAGLLFALLGDGLWDMLSWLLLSLPLLLLAFFLTRKH